MSSFLKASLPSMVNTKQGNTYATYLKENYFQWILLWSSIFWLHFIFPFTQ